MRTERQKIIDQLMLLVLFNLVETLNQSMQGKLKTTKLAFLTEWNLMTNDFKCMNLNFFRWHYGPFSKELYQDLEFLQSNNFINKFFQLGKRGKELSDAAIEVYPDLSRFNKDIFRLIKNNAVRWSKFDGLTLQQMVYGMQFTPHNETKRYKIRDIPIGWDLLVPESFTGEDLVVHDTILEDFRYELSLTVDEVKAAKSVSATSYEQRFN